MSKDLSQVRHSPSKRTIAITCCSERSYEIFMGYLEQAIEVDECSEQHLTVDMNHDMVYPTKQYPRKTITVKLRGADDDGD
jgi:hypothetical protein